MARHTRPLAELRRGDEPLFGGKSSSLGELHAGEIPVPPGFGIAAAAFHEFLVHAQLENHIRHALDGHDPDDLSDVRAVSESIGREIRAAALPESVRDEIGRAYEDLGGPVAVRSSAIGEDSADATFAGQQETYLWVRGADGVAEAVRDCWASLYSPEALSYRAKMGAPDPAMGVTVQAMVDAEVSGVMFTCNPVSGDPSAVAVNASWGLGLAVVGGEVTPDEYRVSKVTHEVLKKEVSSKHVEYVPDPSGAGAVAIDVREERRDVACLDDDRLAELVDVAKRVERHFGSHQDIEWAIARSGGELFMLQSRPVTTVQKKEAEQPAKPASAIDLVLGTFGAKRD